MNSSIALPRPDIGGDGPLLPVSDLFSNKQASGLIHRPIPAPEPNPEPNPGPDAVVCHGHGRIYPADWDELFKSIQVRLEGCVCDAMLKIPDQQLNHRGVLTKTIVIECVQAMKQLQAALNVERSEQQVEKHLRDRSQA